MMKDSGDVGREQFATTRWSLIRAAGGSSTEARDALAVLCEDYWYPLYSFVRRQGHQSAEAQDLTQGFFTSLLQRDDLKQVHPSKGRFRSFLLASLKHFISNQWDRAQAAKRGGGRPLASLDLQAAESRLQLEPSGGATPEAEFDRQWALTLLEHVQSHLQRQAEQAGRLPLFQKLQPLLAGPGGTTYADIAAELDMAEGAVKVAMHRLRKRFRDRLRQEIAQTVETEQEIDDEIQDLFNALQGGRRKEEGGK